ncbi:hypothetical protein [Kordia sp.]|uniref:hypothetical protein n=1 Tax=Kordia sp. TaxID=1965332 RepID=UPI0025BAC911|nr:hypothetical protein [Kordia sp.]MCH2195473.1 hypothetical protein [Kordia sp.]
MNYTNINTQPIPQVAYDIKNTYVYLLESKTGVRYDYDQEVVTINKMTLSESLSIRFKYTLGSLNFLYEQVSEKVVNISERNGLLDRILELFTRLQNQLTFITSEKHVEELIGVVNKEKLDIKIRIPNYL